MNANHSRPSNGRDATIPLNQVSFWPNAALCYTRPPDGEIKEKAGRKGRRQGRRGLHKKQMAVKVIDDRGNELLVVKALS